MSAPKGIVVYRRADGQLVDANGDPIEESRIGVLPTYSVTYNRDGVEVYPDGRPVEPQEGMGAVHAHSFIADQANAGSILAPPPMSPGELAVASMEMLDAVEDDISDLSEEEQAHIRQQVRQHVQSQAVESRSSMTAAPARTPRLDPETLARLQAEITKEDDEANGDDPNTPPAEETGTTPAPATTPGPDETETTETTEETQDPPKPPRRNAAK